MCVSSAPADDDDEDDVVLMAEQIEAFNAEGMARSSAEPSIAAKYKWPKTPITHMVQVPYVINETQYSKHNKHN